MANANEYTVEGYNVRNDEYDAPYLPGADFDPSKKYAHGGDPKAAAKAAKTEVESGKVHRPSHTPKSPKSALTGEVSKASPQVHPTFVNDAEREKREAAAAAKAEADAKREQEKK